MTGRLLCANTSSENVRSGLMIKEINAPPIPMTIFCFQLTRLHFNSLHFWVDKGRNDRNETDAMARIYLFLLHSDGDRKGK